eukprot:8667660-Karenia_brevis.AAC.1
MQNGSSSSRQQINGKMMQVAPDQIGPMETLQAGTASLEQQNGKGRPQARQRSLPERDMMGTSIPAQRMLGRSSMSVPPETRGKGAA